MNKLIFFGNNPTDLLKGATLQESNSIQKIMTAINQESDTEAISQLQFRLNEITSSILKRIPKETRNDILNG